jgi:hypothetical protein
MRYIKSTFGYLTMAAIAAVLAGCLVSGTFVISEVIHGGDFSAGNGFYYHAVDLSTNETWIDHEDDIESIDVIGFEMWIHNNGATATTFDVWIDDIANDSLTSLVDVRDNATQIIDGLSVSPGANFITYGRSLSILTNTETLKRLVRTGSFHYYGYSSAGLPGTNYRIDSIRVIVTLSASGS